MKTICLTIILCLLCQPVIADDICNTTQTVFAITGLLWMTTLIFNEQDTGGVPPLVLKFRREMFLMMVLSVFTADVYGCEWVDEFEVEDTLLH